VSLIAALIALAAPAVTYRANARLDRDRWVRQRRAETYIEALAVLGRLAAYVAEPATRPNPFEAIGGDQWRQFQARVEAFGTTQVIALRDELLATWERYQAATDQDEALETRRAKVRVLYADLISLVREELKQDREPWWRRTRRAA
jgi:hypothetical protein